MPGLDYGVFPEALEEILQEGLGLLLQAAALHLGAVVVGQGEEIGQTAAGTGL